MEYLVRAYHKKPDDKRWVCGEIPDHLCLWHKTVDCGVWESKSGKNQVKTSNGDRLHSIHASAEKAKIFAADSIHSFSK